MAVFPECPWLCASGAILAAFCGYMLWPKQSVPARPAEAAVSVAPAIDLAPVQQLATRPAAPSTIASSVPAPVGERESQPKPNLLQRALDDLHAMAQSAAIPDSGALAEIRERLASGTSEGDREWGAMLDRLEQASALGREIAAVRTPPRAATVGDLERRLAALRPGLRCARALEIAMTQAMAKWREMLRSQLMRNETPSGPRSDADVVKRIAELEADAEAVGLAGDTFLSFGLARLRQERLDLAWLAGLEARASLASDVEAQLLEREVRLLQAPYRARAIAKLELLGRPSTVTPSALSWCKALPTNVAPLAWKGRNLPRRVLHERSGIVLLLVPPGRFAMGSPDDLGSPGEHPRRDVVIDAPFYLGEAEVTQAQWSKIMTSNPSRFRGDDLPVESVSWHDVNGFVRRLDPGFRLPTEAEWEYAARAGSDAEYPFAGGKDRMGLHGWYDPQSDYHTHPVKQLLPNAWGFYDQLGNVWEWCEDAYDERIYGRLTDGAVNPRNPGTGDVPRVLRGGSWTRYPVTCRPAFRGSFDPRGRAADFGFRVARKP